MDTSTIIVRVDQGQHAAEIEIRTPHHQPKIHGIDRVLRQIGVRPLHTLEMTTRRHSITRAKLVECDGSRLETKRVMQILSVVQNPRSRHERIGQGA